MRYIFLITIFITFFPFNKLKGQTWKIETPASTGLILNYNPIDNRIGLGIAHNVEQELSTVVPKKKKVSFFDRHINPKGLTDFSVDYIPKSKIYGIHAGIMFSSIMAFGFNFNYYNKIDKNQFAFCPVIGLSYANIDLLYGYNIYFSKTRIAEINRHSLTIRFYIPIFTDKIKDNENSNK